MGTELDMLVLENLVLCKKAHPRAERTRDVLGQNSGLPQGPWRGRRDGTRGAGRRKGACSA